MLEGLADGLTNLLIGRRLGLSEDTVKTHARRIFKAMDAKSRTDAVRKAYRWGWLTP